MSASLDRLFNTLKRDFGVTPVMAAELEWYVLTQEHEAINAAQREEYLRAMEQACATFPLYSLEKERGAGQVEAALHPTAEIDALLTQLDTLKTIATHTAAQHELVACFDAKPFPQDYGSGLHIHVHLENGERESLYYVQQQEHETILSDMLSWSIGGLLASLPDNISVFAGSTAAMQRYQPWKDAPIAANWGYNNRTTALRLPDNVGHSRGAENILSLREHAPTTRRYKRIEHRAASSEANPADVLLHILSGIYFGLAAHIPAPAPTYGNSYMELEQLSCFL
jgi:gamma-glutamylputrescine synthase